MTRYIYDWSLLLLQCKVMESIVTNIMLRDDFEWAAALSLYLVRRCANFLPLATATTTLLNASDAGRHWQLPTYVSNITLGRKTKQIM